MRETRLIMVEDLVHKTLQSSRDSHSPHIIFMYLYISTKEATFFPFTAQYHINQYALYLTLFRNVFLNFCLRYGCMQVMSRLDEEKASLLQQQTEDDDDDDDYPRFDNEFIRKQYYQLGLNATLKSIIVATDAFCFLSCSCRTFYLYP